jgi:WD40 repeat protein
VAPQGRQLLLGGLTTASLWDLAAGKEMARFEEHMGNITSVGFSSDGRLALTASKDGLVRIWDVAQRKPLGKPCEHRDAVTAAVFAPDEQFLLSGSSDGIVRLWEWKKGECKFRMPGHNGPVKSLAISRDGKRALSVSDEGGDGTLRLWDLQKGEELKRTFGAFDSPCLSVVFLPNGRRAFTGDRKGTLRLWNLDTGKVVARFEQDNGPVFSVAVTADGSRALSGGDDGIVRVWRLPAP